MHSRIYHNGEHHWDLQGQLLHVDLRVYCTYGPIIQVRNILFKMSALNSVLLFETNMEMSRTVVKFFQTHKDSASRKEWDGIKLSESYNTTTQISIYYSSESDQQTISYTSAGPKHKNKVSRTNQNIIQADNPHVKNPTQQLVSTCFI